MTRLFMFHRRGIEDGGDKAQRAFGDSPAAHKPLKAPAGRKKFHLSISTFPSWQGRCPWTELINAPIVFRWNDVGGWTRPLSHAVRFVNINKSGPLQCKMQHQGKANAVVALVHLQRHRRRSSHCGITHIATRQKILANLS